MSTPAAQSAPSGPASFGPGRSQRIGSTWSKAIGEVATMWRQLPLPARLVAVVALYVLLAWGAPSSSVASVMAPQSGWAADLSGQIGTFVLLAIGLNVVVGAAGMLDLGYVAFYAVGAYALGIFTTHDGLNFWEIMPLGIILAAFAGLVLGAPTLRLRGDYLAIVTLGFGLIISQAATNLQFDGGAQGISGIPHPPNIGHLKQFTYGVIDYKPYWYLVLAGIFLAVWVVRRLDSSRIGRGWVAIREDEDVAELMGVPTYRFRLWAFATGAAIGGAGGVLYAMQANHIEPNTFSYQVSILVVAAVVLGGSGNIFGVILGAFVISWLPERFRNFDEYRILVFGIALVVVMIFRPEGLLPNRRRRAEATDMASGGGMGAPLVPPVLEDPYADAGPSA